MISKPPKVTVLALAYNQEKYVVETLNSIADQTFQDFELLIADDASSDSSAAIIRDWNSKHGRAGSLFLHEKNRGLCATLNELLAEAKGEYLQFIACDDHLLPQSLEKRVAVLEKTADSTAAVYSDALTMDQHGDSQAATFLETSVKNGVVPTGDLYSQLLIGNFIPAFTVLSKRALVEEVGGFDESLAFEDWDLWLRLSRKYDFSCLEEPTARYRIHAKNFHKTMQHQPRQFYRILAKHKDSFRARMRILRTMIRNRQEFGADTFVAEDFLSWADQYYETSWFRRWFFSGSQLTQYTVDLVVKGMDEVTRPFSSSTRSERIGQAA